MTAAPKGFGVKTAVARNRDRVTFERIRTRTVGHFACLSLIRLGSASPCAPRAPAAHSSSPPPSVSSSSSAATADARLATHHGGDAYRASPPAWAWCRVASRCAWHSICSPSWRASISVGNGKLSGKVGYSSPAIRKTRSSAGLDGRARYSVLIDEPRWRLNGRAAFPELLEGQRG